MNTDPGIERTRAVREKISREHGNDPRRLVDYYMEYQQQFADRLRDAPPAGKDADGASVGVPSHDPASRGE